MAVSDVSFEVSEGEFFGLIGPNGAGKTTTMECVEGVRQPDRGTEDFMSWLMSKYAPDLAKDRFYVWLDNYHWVPIIVLGVLLFAIGGVPFVP